jgi:rod shape determining protein RodA
LTQAYNDFAFATLAEQFGFIGSLLLFGLYMALLARIIKIAQLTPDRFSKGVCLGITLLILIHVFINIGMNMGELPVTGIPLPLVSYGGSSVFVNLISLGLVQSIARSIRPVDIADNLMLTSHELILRSK